MASYSTSHEFYKSAHKIFPKLAQKSHKLFQGAYINKKSSSQENIGLFYGNWTMCDSSVILLQHGTLYVIL